MTAMMLLTANNLHRPLHEKMASDSQLVNSGLQTVQVMLDRTDDEALRSFRDKCTELDQEAQRRWRSDISIAANEPDFLSFSGAQWGL